jgi:hypothetical protein
VISCQEKNEKITKKYMREKASVDHLQNEWSIIGSGQWQMVRGMLQEIARNVSSRNLTTLASYN